MTELYSLEKMKEKVNTRGRIIAIGISLIAFALICAVLFCALVDFETLKVYKIVGCIISVSCAWGSLYLLVEKRAKLGDEIARLNSFLHKGRRVLKCKVSGISKPKTVADGMVACEVFLDDKSTAVYYDKGLGDVPFSVGEDIEIALVENYIVAYEVKK